MVDVTTGKRLQPIDDEEDVDDDDDVDGFHFGNE
jgi:hypothetical protein